MSLSNPTINDLLLLDLPLLIELLVDETSNHSHLLSTEGLGAGTTEARQRVINLQSAIEIKKAMSGIPPAYPPSPEPGQDDHNASLNS